MRVRIGLPLDFHINMFRYITRSLIMPTPIYPRAQLDQNGQMFNAAARYAPERV